MDGEVMSAKPGDLDYQETHHATNAGRFRSGDVFGWRDDRSETGWCSGIVVSSSFTALTVTVRDIRAAIIKHGART
jgi:hypothetical protein